jgi:hypothetical protein
LVSRGNWKKEKQKNNFYFTKKAVILVQLGY